MKKSTILATALVFTLVLAAGVMAKGIGNAGAAEKATGNVTLESDNETSILDFNAHEAEDDREAKGMIVEKMYDENGNLTITLECDVEYVNVSGDYAYFGANCTEGDWLYVEVFDNATPAADGDEIGYELGNETQVAGWVEDGESINRSIPIEGNLVVHTYN
ncbi:MAG: hypothetical protein R6U44_03530 [Archaeoglobaceae archaeon]